MSIIGAALLLLALVYGRTVSQDASLEHYFNLSGTTLALTIIGYGHMTACAVPQNLGRYRTNNGQRAARGPNWSAAFDPERTLDARL